MNKKEVQKKYNKKIRLIDEYNKYYYSKSSPLVSDKEYDEIKNDIYILMKLICRRSLVLHYKII